MAFDGKLQFNTAIDTAGFLSGIKNIDSLAKQGLSTIASFSKSGVQSIVSVAEKSTDLIKKSVKAMSETLSKSLTETLNGMKKLGEYAVNLSKSAIEMGQTFEKSMSNVIATMGKTKDDLVEFTNADGTTSLANTYDMLSAKAKEMGAKTQFSASQAADALNYLALAGYDAQKACNALPSVLNLAAAGDMDLAYASDLATDAMAALGMEATTENLTHFGDSLAKTASRSNTSVAQLGEAILVCGGQAKLAGLDLVEMNTMLGILADNGIKGSEGGTALRNVLKNIYTPTSTASQAMEALGISTSDANGNLRDIQDVLIDTMAAIQQLDEASRIQAIGDIFDTRTIAAASAALNNSKERYNALSAEIENCDGAMAQMAETMNDNFKGDILILQSALEGLGNTFYESVVETLRQTTQEAATWIGHLDGLLKVDGFNGLARAIGDVFKEIIQKAYLEIPKALDIGEEFIENLCNGMLNSTRHIEVLGGKVLADMVKSFSTAYTTFYSAGTEILSSILKGLAENSRTISESANNFITSILLAIETYLPQMAQSGIEIFKALINGFSKILPTVVSSVGNVFESLLKIIRNSLPDFLKTGKKIIDTLLMGFMGVPVDETMLDIAIDIINSLVKFVTENLPIVIEIGLTLIENLIDGIFNGFEEIKPLISSLIEKICTIATEHLPEILEIGFKILISLIDGIIENLPIIVDTAVEILLALADFISENIGLLIDSAIEIITTICEELVTEENLKKLINSAIEILKGIADGIKNNLPLLVDCATQIIGELMRYLNDEKNQKDIRESAGEVVGKLISAMVDSADEVVEFVSMLLVELGKSVANTDWSKIGKDIANGILSGLFGVEWNSEEFLEYFMDYYQIGFKGNTSDIKKHFVPEIFTQEEKSTDFKDIFISENKEIPITANTEQFDKSLEEIYNQERSINFDVKTGLTYDLNSEEKVSIISEKMSIDYENLAGRFDSAFLATQSEISKSITTSCEPINKISSEVKTGFEEALKNANLDGDTYLTVNIGNERFESMVISAIDKHNARTGGRY